MDTDGPPYHMGEVEYWGSGLIHREGVCDDDMDDGELWEIDSHLVHWRGVLRCRAEVPLHV